MGFQLACRLSDLADQAARLVDVGGAKVLLVRQGERVFASSHRCPHLGLSLENGELGPGSIRCRAHGYKMELATGDCVSEKGLSIDVYPVELRSGEVWVALPKK